MDLPSITNAPRELPLGGAIFRARALTLADLGEVLAWLDDRIPRGDDDGPTLLSGETARVALASTEGLAVVLHLALLSCQPSMTRGEARALAAEMTEDEERRLKAIAFRRRPNYDPPGEGKPGKDLAEIQWGGIIEALAQGRAWVYQEACRLTLDQYDNRVKKGEWDEPDDLKPSDVQRMWEEAMKPIPEVLP